MFDIDNLAQTGVGGHGRTHSNIECLRVADHRNCAKETGNYVAPDS